jgi:hypothetical protein
MFVSDKHLQVLSYISGKAWSLRCCSLGQAPGLTQKHQTWSQSASLFQPRINCTAVKFCKTECCLFVDFIKLFSSSLTLRRNKLQSFQASLYL